MSISCISIHVNAANSDTIFNNETEVSLEPDNYIQHIYGNFTALTDKDKEIEIGMFYGNIIDCSRVARYGEEFWDVCDATSADMEYIASTLMSDQVKKEYDIDLDESVIFYLDLLYINPEYRNQNIGTKILRRLPVSLDITLNTAVDVIVLFSQAVEKNADGHIKRIEKTENFRNRIRVVEDNNEAMLKSLKLNGFFIKNGFEQIPESELFIKPIDIYDEI